MEPTEETGSAPPEEGSTDRVRVLLADDPLVREALRFHLEDVPGRSPLGEAAASPGRRGLRLTPRQRAILRLAALGRTDKEIAGALGVWYDTVRTHLKRLHRAHGVPNRIALVALWLVSLAEGGSASLGGCDALGAPVSLFLGTCAWHRNCSRPCERMGRCSADPDPRAAPSTEEASAAGPVRGREVTPVDEDRRRRGGRTSPIRVVIAEDEPAVRAALRALLEDEADIAVVGEAGDGVEAICATERFRPDVLLLDLAMPKIAGAEAAKVLRQLVPGTRIVVLTCTGPTRAPELLRLDVHGYLCKPVEGPELADAIRAAHGGGVWLAPAAARWLAASRAPAASLEPTPRERLEPTPREYEVLRLVAEGCSSRRIAARLSVCERTVASHIASLCAKLGAHDRAELVHRAHQRGWPV